MTLQAAAARNDVNVGTNDANVGKAGSVIEVDAKGLSQERPCSCLSFIDGSSNVRDKNQEPREREQRRKILQPADLDLHTFTVHLVQSKV